MGTTYHGSHSTDGSAIHPAPVLENPSVLCDLCKKIPSLARRNDRIFFGFYTTQELAASVARGCHSCWLIKAQLATVKERPERELSSVDREQPFFAELRWYYDRRIDLLLWHDVYSDPLNLGLGFRDGETAPQAHTSLSGSTGSESTWAQIEKWNERCQSNKSCRTQAAAISDENYPGRLLYVGGCGNHKIKVCKTKEFKEPVEYLTLSHCWGSHQPYRLLTENYDELVNGLSTTELPKTFQDAIKITQKFGKEHLWIDSLCIIQDDENDWRIESKKMRQTYINSWLNIAAASAKNATEGLFNLRDSRNIVPCCFPSGNSERVLRTEYHVDGGVCLPLERRAWVYQERLLAPRMLQYGAQEVLWECGCLGASETYPNDYGTACQELQDIELEEPSAQLEDIHQAWRDLPLLDSLQRWKLWNTIIGQYTGLKLTKTSDRLVALSGLAGDMDAAWSSASYLAGLWSYKLRSGLLWCCNGMHPHPLPRDCQNPSWTWARMDGFTLPYQCTTSRIDGLAEIIDASVDLTSPTDLFTDVLGGRIKIRAPMLKTKVRRKSSSIHENWYMDLFAEQQSSSGNSSSAIASERDGSADMHDKDDEMLSEPVTNGKRKGETSESELSPGDSAGPSSEIPDVPVPSVPITISWDIFHTMEAVETACVYLIPLETALRQTDLSKTLELQGLVVDPTEAKKGQIQRLAWFSVSEQWPRGLEDSHGSPDDGASVSEVDTTMAKLSLKAEEGEIVEGDRSYTGHEDEEIDDSRGSDNCDDAIEHDEDEEDWPHYLTVHDVGARMAKLKAMLDKDGRARRNTEELTKRMTALAESLDYHEDLDKYANGPVHNALIQRYGPSTNGLYPRIDSFLTTIYNKYAKPNGDTRELSDLFEEDHGNGYFTFELV